MYITCTFFGSRSFDIYTHANFAPRVLLWWQCVVLRRRRSLFKCRGCCRSLTTTNMLLSDLNETLCNQSHTARLCGFFTCITLTLSSSSLHRNELVIGCCIYLFCMRCWDCLRQLVIVIMPKQRVCIFNKCLFCQILIYGFMSNSWRADTALDGRTDIGLDCPVTYWLRWQWCAV